MATEPGYLLAANPKLRGEVSSDGIWTPHISIEGNVTLDVSHVEIGGVFIQDETSGDSVSVDANGALLVTVGNGTVPVSAVSLPLPALAATSTNQTTEISALGNISTAIGLQAKLTDTQPVSILSSVALTAAVTVTSGNVAISNTPAVTLASTTISSGNITATLAAGSAVIGHVVVDSGNITAAISGAVTVTSGNIAISNTPAVTLASTTITSGNIAISNTPAVTLAATTITSGNITVANGNLTNAVNIQDGGNSITVDGTVTATVTGATIASGNISVPNLELTQGSDFTDVLGPMVQGVVSDTPESWIGGEIRPISITSEGRVRVSTLPAYTEFDFFSMAGQVASTIWSVPNPWGI